MNKTRIYIKSIEKYYAFVEISVEKDGSIELAFPSINKGKGISQTVQLSITNGGYIPSIVEEKSRDTDDNCYISYHSSGLVRYHSMSFEPAYMQPVYAVTEENTFFIYSFTELQKAFSESGFNKTNISGIIDFSKLEKSRLDIVFSVVPKGGIRDDKGIVGVELPTCDLEMDFLQDIGTLNLSEIYREDESVKLRPHLDKSAYQMVSKDKAALSYKHCLYQDEEMFIISPNKEGVFELVLKNEMRRSPWLKIELADDNYHVIPANDGSTPKIYSKRFKIFDKKQNCYVKETDIIIIKQIVLDAEIYDVEDKPPDGYI